MLTVVTAATVEPVSIEQARAHLRLVHTDDDAMISGIISAARESVEMATGRALAVASYSWTPDGDLAAAIDPPPPIQPATVTSAAGVVPILFTTAPGIVPSPLQNAMLLMIGDMYENTSANIVGPSVARNPAVDVLMYPYRRNVGV